MTRIALLLSLVPLAACGDEPCEPGPGQICTIAGTGTAGFGGDDGPATEARLYLPQDVTEGPDGHLYLTDWNNHRVRGIAPDGTIRTVAGTGLLGDGPEGPALEAAFNHPTQVVFDGAGRMLIAAWHNSRIKRMDMTSGQLEDICGTGGRAYLGDDGPATDAVLDLPAGLALDDNGDLYVLDQANQVIRTIDGNGVITRFAGQCVIGECDAGEEPVACPGTDKTTCSLDTDPDACSLPCTPSFAGDDGPALEMRMAQPFGQAADPAGKLAFDSMGNLYFSDTRNHRVRMIDTSGMVITVAGTGTAGFAGDGGPAEAAQLSNPTDLEIGADGTLYIADTRNSCVRAVYTDGTIGTAAGVCGQSGFGGDGGDATDALLDRPYGIELDREGNLYIVDTYNHRIRIVAR